MSNRKYVDTYSGKVKSNRHARFIKQRGKDIRAINVPSGFCDSGVNWSDTYSEYILPDGKFGGVISSMLEIYRQNDIDFDLNDLDYTDLLYGCGKDLPTRKAYPKRRWRKRYGCWLRKNCNRRFRRQKRDFLGKSNAYRHCTEFWWDIF